MPKDFGRMLLRMEKPLFAMAMILLTGVFGADLAAGQDKDKASSAGNTTNVDKTINAHPRALELGIKIGVLPSGPLDAITDVDGVQVGHTTIIRGDNIRTGVTAVLPHSGNLYREKVPGAIFSSNGFGKLAGSTQ